MVLSQGFLNLLLWDPEDDEFPEVGGGARPCGAGAGPARGRPLTARPACPPDPADGPSAAAGAGGTAAPANHPGLRLAGFQQLLWQRPVWLTSVCG